jgi:cardiolipin synthase A/B
VDGCWCAVGSTNFDDRSFDTNDEITLGVLDSKLAARFDAIFEKYAQRADEVKLQEWHKRGFLHKIKDNAAYLLNDVL